ncbi:MAG: ORF6N domain-containing protein [Bacteroidota bacterium]
MEIQHVQTKIYVVRGQNVMLDKDLAGLYGIETKRLKEAVKRNMRRFPPDFMIELSKDEMENLRSHFATSSWGGNRYGTFAFTEHGILMLSSVLNSDNAVEVNIQIMRAFVVMRKYAVTYEDLAKRVMELEGNYSDIYEALNHLLKENKMKEEQGYRKRIGY